LNPLLKREEVDPVLALKGASETLQLAVEADGASATKDEDQKYTITGSKGTLSDPKANLVYFQKGNELVLSWRVETDIGENWLLSYVDATSPEKVLGVVDYVNEASYDV
jgi:extracellular elastinolytic metalloproteinase